MQTISSLKALLRSANRINLFLQISVPLMLIIFAVAFQISSLNESREQQLTRTRLSAQDLGATLAASIAGAFQNIDITLLAAADYVRNQPSLENIDERKLNSTLTALQRRVPSLILLRATNQVGDVLFDSNADYAEKVNIADRQYFQALKSNPGLGMVISEPVLGRLTKKWVVICARRFNLPNGEFGGVIYASVELIGFTDKITGKDMALNENDAFVLRDDQSNVIIRYAHGKQDMSMTGKKVVSPNIIAFDKSGENSTSYDSTSVLDKVARVFYLQRIKDQPMSIIVGLSIEDALASYRVEAQKKWIITIVFVLVVLVAFFLIQVEQFGKLKVIQDLEGTSEKLKQLIHSNETILLNSPLPIGVYTADGKCLTVNEALANLMGTTRQALLRQNFRQISGWKNSGLLDACLQALNTQQRTECEVKFTTESGKMIVGECHILSVNQNNQQLLLIQFVDLSEIKQVNSKLENILRSMNEGVHVIDGKGMIILENEASISMLGWSGENIIGRPAHLTIHHHRADLSVFPVEECPIFATLLDGKVRHVEDDVFWRRDGTCFPVEYTATPIMNPHGERNAVTVVFRDITYRKRLEDELRKQATHDVLTGLPNRRLLMDRLGQAININRRQNTHGALLFLDLNNFKELNDNYGHEAGDYLLIEVAKRLTHSIRDSDTVARMGGDEFVVLLLGLDANYDLARKYVELVIEKLSRKINEDYLIGDIAHRCTASIGSKIFYNDDIPEKILKEADADMYRAKRAKVVD